MENLPQVIAAVASLVVAITTLVQVMKGRADVQENTTKTVAAAADAKDAATKAAEVIGTVNGHGTAMEALTENAKVLNETVAKGDELLELSKYTHASVHELRNAITPLTPLAPLVVQLVDLLEQQQQQAQSSGKGG